MEMRRASETLGWSVLLVEMGVCWTSSHESDSPPHEYDRNDIFEKVHEFLKYR